ncbi:Uma2 family endonuclease [Zavarzinella formosa]|uniref:Uma2 family endonuclease n=1 Tax=Zavarzinella formosa TaxID=360055 RepID=UPI0002FABCFA|nr:Uma2 family endonuclease [Zavarzinella formosa]
MVVKTDPVEIASLTFRDLPDTDGEIVNNPYQAPQLNILSASMRTWLAEHHPSGDAFIGPDTGIYWLPTNPPMAGCRAPDWFYVPGVPAMEEGEIVRSYVMWQHDYAPPYFLVELVSGPGGGEHDDTPNSGKFWIYEQRVRAEYYVIFDTFSEGELEVFHLENGRYRRMEPNAAGRYLIPAFGYEVGVVYETHELFYEGYYIRFFTPDGKIVPLPEEIAAQANEKAAEERKAQLAATRRMKSEQKARQAADERAESEKQRAEAATNQLQELLKKLREQGIDPEAL